MKNRERSASDGSDKAEGLTKITLFPSAAELTAVVSGSHSLSVDSIVVL